MARVQERLGRQSAKLFAKYGKRNTKDLYFKQGAAYTDGPGY